MKMYECLQKISLKFVPKIRINNSIGSDNDLALVRRQALIWTNGVSLMTHMCHTMGDMLNKIDVGTPIKPRLPYTHKSQSD